MLGQVVDSMCRPYENHGVSTFPERIPSLRHDPIRWIGGLITAQPLDLGVRSINACLVCGKGQRQGIFAGSGVGKSVLLGMMAAKYTSADVVVVIGLIGERGREVREFIERELGEEGRKKSVVVVETADKSPIRRARGAYVAAAVAEYFRNRGAHVLLMMDSLTRFAMAQREIGIAAGEPPTTKGYTPSVFSTLSRLVERAGNWGDKGSITGLYTVLVEGDDLEDPVADSARAILDGHIVLARRLANRRHYPAVDILSSVSRVMDQVVDKGQVKAAPDHEAAARALSGERGRHPLRDVRAWNRSRDRRVHRYGVADHGLSPTGSGGAGFFRRDPRAVEGADRMLKTRYELGRVALTRCASFAPAPSYGPSLHASRCFVFAGPSSYFEKALRIPTRCEWRHFSAGTSPRRALIMTYHFRLEKMLHFIRLKETMKKMEIVSIQKRITFLEDRRRLIAGIDAADPLPPTDVLFSLDQGGFGREGREADRGNVWRRRESIWRKKKAELSRLMMRKKGLESLKEKKRQEFQVESNRRAQRRMDDLYSVRRKGGELEVCGVFRFFFSRAVSGSPSGMGLRPGLTRVHARLCVGRGSDGETEVRTAKKARDWRAWKNRCSSGRRP